MIGRLLGGIATSLLYSSFESWMVAAHNKQGFDDALLGQTFSRAILGNGLVAIVSGVFASTLAEKFGLVAPFDAAIVVMSIGAIIIVTTWEENFGDKDTTLSGGCSDGWAAIRKDKAVMLLGWIQSLFEGAMFIFVFMWTPKLEESMTDIKHGMVFACFMVCVMLGSSLFGTLLASRTPEQMIVPLFAVAAFSLFVPVFASGTVPVLGSFFLFEVCCGVFWPALGTLRSKYIPEDQRASIMNIFRIPLNVIVVLALLNIKQMTNSQVFVCCTVSLLICLACSVVLTNELSRRVSSLKDGGEMSEVASMI